MCIWGDGDFLKQLNVTDSLSQISSLTDNFELLDGLKENITQDSLVAKTQLDNIDLQMKQGQDFIDPADAGAQTPAAVLTTLNSWSDSSVAGSDQAAAGCSVT